MADTLIRIRDVNKSFGDNHVVRDLQLDIYDGEFLTLLGPSGCGKTTILRMLAGFETPDTGDIRLEGTDLLSIPANKRQINTVFQSYALFPHLTVRENIGFGLKMKKTAGTIIDVRVDRVLTLLQLESLADRKPAQLSGGQQQRAAIARGLVNEPRVLLLDEPLGALDMQLRKQMQLELRRFQKELGITFVYVTHDQEEALTMSDRIAVMNRGRVEQIDSPRNIYLHPETSFVADFLGGANFLEGRYDGGRFRCEDTVLALPEGCAEAELVSIRPEFIGLSVERADNSIPAEITGITFMGQVNRAALRLPSGREIYALTTSDDLCAGERIFAVLPQKHLIPIAKEKNTL